MARYTGARASVFIDSFNSTNVLTAGSTTAGEKYFVIDKAITGSKLPVSAGTFFIAPRTGTQITLTAGDKVMKIQADRFCKTNASFSFEESSVDVSDDCNPGTSILSGVVTFSGSLSGLFDYNKITEEFDDVTNNILNRFLDVVKDDAGVITVSPRDDSDMYLLVCLNTGVKAGQFENWLLAPIVITSFNFALGNADAQSKELSFTKGLGQPIIYSVQK
jgi:hypothetical protein